MVISDWESESFVDKFQHLQICFERGIAIVVLEVVRGYFEKRVRVLQGFKTFEDICVLSTLLTSDYELVRVGAHW